MHNDKGQTLIEVLVALATSVVIASAITTLSIYSLNNTQFSKSQSLATQYAQEGVEVVRLIRDDSYATTYTTLVTNSNPSYCIPAGSLAIDPSVNNITSYPGSVCPKNVPLSDPTFIRQVDFRKDGCDATIDRATVTVSWTDGHCSSATDYCHKVTIDSCLGKPYVAPTP